ncbi:MAG: hypothetical protein JSV04_09145 [Candidatus Heimdallarchaeota archaeon]|nr:MAG: hypothetical protein JSV04_09145 [Candidatus Heimdallarchaeota archaeon]
MPLEESNLVLRSVSCDKTGVEPICVLCPECEECQRVPREIISFENGQLIRQGNSAIVSLKLQFNDPVEEFIFDRIRNELWRNAGSRLKVIREPEEGYQISFFLNIEMVATAEQRETLIDYWEKFSINMRRILTDGKMVINKYVRSRAEASRLS